MDGEGRLYPIPFPDIREHWSRYIISELYVKGIVLGDNGYFYPNKAISRKECAALLLRAMLSPEELQVSKTEGFSLCPEDDWAYPYLNYLASREIIPHEISQFDPDTNCSREEAFTWLWKVAGSPVTENFHQEVLTDLTGVPIEAAAAVKWLYKLELVKGYEDNTVRLANSITRAEVSTILYRLLGITSFIE